MLISPPQNVSELLARAQALSGLSLGQIAERHQVDTYRPHKGWAGQLIEIALGATAGSKPEPDFMGLGVELKTLPIDCRGKPTESTFICAAPRTMEASWRESSIYRKLAKVLWIPILTEKSIPLLERKIGLPIFWSPSQEQEAILKEDWEELSESLMLGKAGGLTAKYGQYLQVRPKAANSRVLIQDVNEEGELCWVVPRGFYLRTCFTREIVHLKQIPQPPSPLLNAPE
jgi:DNA mismatch repair protein MutH